MLTEIKGREKCIIFIILILIFIGGGDNKEEIEKYLNSIKEKIEALRKKLTEVARKRANKSKFRDPRLKARIKKKIIRKLATPSFRFPQHSIIKIKPEENINQQDVSDEPNKKSYTQTTEQSSYSSLIKEVVNNLPPYLPFKLPDLKKYMLLKMNNSSENSKGSSSNITTTITNKPEFNPEFENFYRKLREWYEEVALSALRLWQFIESSRSYLVKEGCKGELLPSDFFLRDISSGKTFIYFELFGFGFNFILGNEKHLCLADKFRFIISKMAMIENKVSLPFQDISSCLYRFFKGESSFWYPCPDNIFYFPYKLKIDFTSKYLRQYFLLGKVLISNIIAEMVKGNSQGFNNKRDKEDLKFILYKLLYEKKVSLMGRILLDISKTTTTIPPTCENKDIEKYEELHKNIIAIIDSPGEIHEGLRVKFREKRPELYGKTFLDTRRYNEMLNIVAEYDMALFQKLFDEVIPLVHDASEKFLLMEIENLKKISDESSLKCIANKIIILLTYAEDSHLYLLARRHLEGYVLDSLVHISSDRKDQWWQKFDTMIATFSIYTRLATPQEKFGVLSRLFDRKEWGVFSGLDYILYFVKSLYRFYKEKMPDLSESDILKQKLRISGNDIDFYSCWLKSSDGDLKKCFEDVYKDSESYKLLVMILENSGITGEIKLNSFENAVEKLNEYIGGKRYLEILKEYEECCLGKCIEKGDFCNKVLCENKDGVVKYCPPREPPPDEGFYFRNDYIVCSDRWGVTNCPPVNFQAPIGIIKNAIKSIPIFCRNAEKILKCCKNCNTCSDTLGKIFCETERICDIIKEGERFCPERAKPQQECILVSYEKCLQRDGQECPSSEKSECDKLVSTMNGSFPKPSPAKIFCKMQDVIVECCNSCKECEGVSSYCQTRFSDLNAIRTEYENDLKNIIGAIYFEDLKERIKNDR